MTEKAWRFVPLTRENQGAVQDLILGGLEEHWGPLDLTLNSDLNDMVTSYSSGKTVVAVANADQVVGTGTLVRRGPTAAEVVRMSVAPDQRRTGLGRAIVQELIAEAHAMQCNELVLETSSHWTGAVAFYKSCGFAITHTEPSPFGEDTWFRMALD